MPASPAGLVRERAIDVGTTLGCYRHGADPTTWLRTAGTGPSAPGWFVRATHTPDGPGTLRLEWGGAAVGAEAIALDGVGDVFGAAYGPGGPWMLAHAADLVGAGDDGDHGLEQAPDTGLAAAARARRSMRLGASHDLYHELLPTVIAQRITSGEARRQWRRLCAALGEPAPGPFGGLLLPPAPSTLARQPSWRFHRLGIERSRAETLIGIARHPRKLWEWAALGPVAAAQRLAQLRGVGRWTIGSVLGPALGDPDAVAVGDYHLKNIVGWALAGEARATDERMLELLEPYRGQRGRVARLLKMHGPRVPAFGPRQRILPMRDW